MGVAAVVAPARPATGSAGGAGDDRRLRQRGAGPNAGPPPDRRTKAGDRLLTEAVFEGAGTATMALPSVPLAGRRPAPALGDPSGNAAATGSGRVPAAAWRWTAAAELVGRQVNLLYIDLAAPVAGKVMVADLDALA